MTTLEFPVLILDKGYRAVKFLTGRDAVMLLFSEKAQVLDASYQTYSLDEWIEYSKNISQSDLPVLRSKNVNFIIPEVIILPHYTRKPGHGKRLKYSRASIFKRDANTCQYCGRVFHRQELTVDHVTPKSRGGKSTWLNIATACKPCNGKKANRTPEEAGMKLLTQPKIPTWKESVDIPPGMKREMWDNFLKA
jgi:5-methylcytosine-specific restriction endonuclease McrA